LTDRGRAADSDAVVGTDGGYFARLRERSLEQDGAETLQRALGTWQLLLFGVGTIIGAGIFVAPGNVAAHYTGPAIVLSFLVAGTASLCAALCYAEFAAMVPVSGSAYSYAYAAFGPLAGWLIGWCLVLEYLAAAATVAVGWSGYFASLARSMGLTLPALIAAPPLAILPGGSLFATGALVNGPGSLLLVALVLLLVRGVRVSARVNSVLVVVKLTVIALFIIWGAGYVDTRNWHPFLPPNQGSFGSFGWSGVLRGAGMVFYAYLGFDTVSTAAREARQAQRKIPLAILSSLAVCTAVYILFSLVLTGLCPYPLLAAADPTSAALDHAGGGVRALKLAVQVGATLGLISVILALLYGLSRILYAMAQDRLVPAIFGRIGARSKVPYGAILACGLTAAVLAALLPLDLLGQLISIGTLAAFVFVCAGVLYLRIVRPHVARPFRTPFAPLVCVSGALICGYLMVGLPATTWTQFLLWSALGLGIYFCYGKRRLHRPNS
jgi:basic amino acid/polyamine antiporter, APA family